MTTTDRPPIKSDAEFAEVLADVLRRLDEFEKNVADRIDVRTSEIVETIVGVSPHQLREFVQERDHGLVYDELLEL